MNEMVIFSLKEAYVRRQITAETSRIRRYIPKMMEEHRKVIFDKPIYAPTIQ